MLSRFFISYFFVMLSLFLTSYFMFPLLEFAKASTSKFHNQDFTSVKCLSFYLLYPEHILWLLIQNMFLNMYLEDILWTCIQNMFSENVSRGCFWTCLYSSRCFLNMYIEYVSENVSRRYSLNMYPEYVFWKCI